MMRLDLKRRRFDEPSSIADRPKHGDREGAHNFKLEGERTDSRGLDRSEARTGPEARAAALCPEAQGFLAPAIRLKLIAGVMPVRWLPILYQRCFESPASSFLDSIGQNANNSPCAQPVRFAGRIVRQAPALRTVNAPRRVVVSGEAGLR